MTAVAKLFGGYWHVQAAPHVVLRLKRVFPRVDEREHGTVRLKATAEVAADLRWFAERYPMSFEPRDVLDREADGFLALRARWDGLLSGTVDPQPFELALPPRDYQRIGAELALATGGLLLADDLGVGKTVTAICWMTPPEVRPVLVVCYPHLQEQWRRELARFAPGLRVHVVSRSEPYDIVAETGPRNRMFVAATFPDVVICTYSKLRKWAASFADVVRGVCFDEVQELRKTDSQKWAAAAHVAETASYRLGLSATPIYNYGGEFHAVLSCLRPDALGSREEFLREWCWGTWDKARISDPRAFGRYLRENGLMLRRTRADVSRELPSLVRVPHAIDADAAALDAVEDRAGELARIILANSAAWEQRGMAARELDALARQATGIAKAKAVAAFVKMLLEAGEKVVLFGWHRQVYDIWLRELRAYDPVLYTGSETPQQKERSRTAFVDGDARLLVMSLRAGAGLDGLQAVCRTVVFGELDWSAGVHEQCMGRVHRDGQPEPVTAYFLIADSGSDPVVADVLGIKAQQLEGARDPDAALVEELQVDENHVKKLAETYLRAKVGAGW